MDEFEQLLGAPPSGAPEAPQPSQDDPSAELSALLYTSDAMFDVPLEGPHDLNTDAMLEQLLDATSRMRSMSLFDTPFGDLGPVYMDTPYPDDEALEDAFARSSNSAPESGGVFYPPVQPPLPANAQTFGPLMRATRPGMGALGESFSPLADPTGELLRGALRRLVRSV